MHVNHSNHFSVVAQAFNPSFRSGGYGGNELERAGAFRVYNDPDDMLQHLEQLGLPGKKS